MEIIIYFPLILILGYTVWVLIKPQSVSDEFFHLHKTLSEEALLKRVDFLENHHRADYTLEKERIARYFRDGKLSEKELESLEDLITRTYFDGFYKRWTVFKRADLFSRFVFIGLVVSGLTLVAYVFSFVSHKNPDFYDLLYGFIGAIILFPFSYAVILILLGLLSFLLTIFRFIFPIRGSLLRATILSEEFVKALKPGGRSTNVVLPKGRIRPGSFWP